MRVTILGSGYVGLVSGACLAALNQRNREAARLEFTTDTAYAVHHGPCQLIAEFERGAQLQDAESFHRSFGGRDLLLNPVMGST